MGKTDLKKPGEIDPHMEDEIFDCDDPIGIEEPDESSDAQPRGQGEVPFRPPGKLRLKDFHPFDLALIAFFIGLAAFI